MFIRIARPSWRTARQQNRVSDAVRSQVQLRTSFSTLPEDEPWDESWREPAPFPHYNGWDHEMEADFQRRLNPNTWKSTEPIPNKRDGICDSMLDLIGQTPMVRMSRLAKALSLPDGIELLAKCEFMNAGGSVKDRIGLRMIEEAEKDGRIKPGDVVIEPTSGNTGIGLCIAAAIKGYKTIMAMPLKMSGEKVNTMKALGAEILRTPNEAAWDAENSHIALSADLASVSPNAHMLDQYINAGNPLAHYEGTAEEILRQTRGSLDVLVLAAGTGGTITGVARKIKEAVPGCKVVGVDPVGSDLAVPESMNKPHPKGMYQVEGIGYDFIPTVLQRDLIDEWVKVDDPEAFKMAKMMMRYEGMLVGGSSGSCMAGAYAYVMKHAAQLQGKRVVILCPDSVRNYMSKFLDDEWMDKFGFENSVREIDAENDWVVKSPSDNLKALVSKKRLDELDAALEMGSLEQGEYDERRAYLLSTFGPPSN